MSKLNIYFWALIVLGIVMRLWSLDHLDLTTDEAQFILESRAHPPLGLFFLHLFQAVFGHTIVMARLVSALFGIATIFLFGAYVQSLQKSQHTVLLVMVLAALFTPHILLSKLIYLDVIQTFFWVLLLWRYQLATQNIHSRSAIFWLFFAAMCSCLVKVQGGLLPCALLLLHVMIHYKAFYKNSITWALVLSGIPAALYMLSIPDIGGIIIFFRSSFIGFYDPVQRVIGTLNNWWQTLGIFSILLLSVLSQFKKISFPVWSFLAAALIMNILLSAQLYYTAYLIILVLPIGYWLNSCSMRIQLLLTIALCLWSIGVTRFIIPLPWQHSLYASEQYWSNSIDVITSHLDRGSTIVALGIFGHQVNWYLPVTIVNGNGLNPQQLRSYNTIVVFAQNLEQTFDGYKNVYSDDYLRIWKR